MWTNERPSLRPTSIDRMRYGPQIRASAAAASAGIPNDRAAMFVEPAGTIARAALEPKIPVATSATVPSPPTATTMSADFAARLAAAVASDEEFATWTWNSSSWFTLTDRIALTWSVLRRL